MATLSVQTIVDSGLTGSLAAVGASDQFIDDGSGRTFIEVANASGSSINVTITAVQTSANVPGVGVVTVSDIVVAVGNGVTKKIGPFTTAYRNSTGYVTVTCSATSSVTIGAFKCAKED